MKAFVRQAICLWIDCLHFLPVDQQFFNGIQIIKSQQLIFCQHMLFVVFLCLFMFQDIHRFRTAVNTNERVEASSVTFLLTQNSRNTSCTMSSGSSDKVNRINMAAFASYKHLNAASFSFLFLTSPDTAIAV